MVRPSWGAFSCIRRIRSRNLVRVRAVVAICWRKVAMKDYSPRTAREISGNAEGMMGPKSDYTASTTGPDSQVPGRRPVPTSDPSPSKTSIKVFRSRNSDASFFGTPECIPTGLLQCWHHGQSSHGTHFGQWGIWPHWLGLGPDIED